jgi:hypothetical protein
MTTNKNLRIADIQTSDILFYDDGQKDRCYKVCAERNIDCLPALDEPRTLYSRDDALQKFRSERLGDERKLGPEVNIFDSAVLEKFRLQPLLMVYQGNDLEGVVHFSDYNKPLVRAYLYGLLHEYEKSLRALLIRNGFKNVDMIAYFSDKKARDGNPELYETKINDYFKYGSQKKLPQFEVFYVWDLIALVNHKHILKLSDKSKLRNMLMHANEFANPEDPGAENFIYDFETFENFFRWTQELQLDYKRVTNRLVFTL